MISLAINFKDMYEGRIEVIDKLIRKAITQRKWTDKAKLEAEKAELQHKIARMR